MRHPIASRPVALCAMLTLLWALPAWPAPAVSSPAVSNSVISVTLPTSQVTFRPGPGSDLASARCTVCHSADYVYMQPPLERAQWEALAKKMQKAFGCPIDEGAINTVVNYLTQQNGPRK